MLRISLMSALALSLLFVACGDKNDTGTKGSGSKDSAGQESKGGANGESSSSDESGSTGKKKYEVKSGIIEMTTSMMPGMQLTTYFDDYGAKEAVVTKVEMLGQATETVQITADGYMISYDAGKKTGTKTKAPASSPLGGAGGAPNFADLTDADKEKYKYEEIEGKTIAGKEAKGVSMEVMGMKVKAWTWSGLPLSVEMVAGEGKAITMEATKVETDIDIPADRFVVPADVKITDM